MDQFGYEIFVKDAATQVLKSVQSQLATTGTAAATASAKGSTGFGALGASAKSLVSSIGGVVMGYMALSRVLGVVTDAIKGAEDQARAEKGVELAYGEGAKALTDYATRMMSVSSFADDAILKAQAMAGKFRLQSDAVMTLTDAALDWTAAQKLAGEENASLTGNLNLLGRAMVGNVTMIERMGIKFTEAEKAILKTGTEAAKAALIFNKFNATFGGSAAAELDGYTGQLTRLKNVIGDYTEALATSVTQNEAVKAAFSETAKVIVSMTEQLGSANTAELIKSFTLGIMQIGVGAGVTAAMVSELGTTIVSVIKLLALASPAPVIGRLFGVDTTAWGSIRQDIEQIQKFFTNPLEGHAATDFALQMQKAADAVRLVNVNAVDTKPRAIMPMSEGIEGDAKAAEDAAKKALAAQRALWAEQEEWQTYLGQRAMEQLEAEYAAVMDIATRQQQADEEAAALQEAYQLRQREAQSATFQAWRDGFTGNLVWAESGMVNWSQTMARYSGSMWQSALSPLKSGMADLLVDGKADWNSLGKAMLKSMIQLTMELGIAVALSAIFRANMAAATGGISEGAGALFGAFHGGGMIFHSGGMIPYAHAGMYLRSDERLIVGQTREGVLNREATRRIGGEYGVNALNSGAKIGGDTIHQYSITVPVTVRGGNADETREAVRQGIKEALMDASRRGEKVIYKEGII